MKLILTFMAFSLLATNTHATDRSHCIFEDTKWDVPARLEKAYNKLKQSERIGIPYIKLDEKIQLIPQYDQASDSPWSREKLSIEGPEYTEERTCYDNYLGCRDSSSKKWVHGGEEYDVTHQLTLTITHTNPEENLKVTFNKNFKRLFNSKDFKFTRNSFNSWDELNISVGSLQLNLSIPHLASWEDVDDFLRDNGIIFAVRTPQDDGACFDHAPIPEEVYSSNDLDRVPLAKL